MRRPALAALLALAASLAALAAPAGAAAAEVTVVSPGGAQQAISLEAMAGGEDVRERTYLLRGSAGESSRTVTGFSLAAVLAAADADPFSFSYLEVQRPGGGAVTLSRHQALEPGAFADGPPVLYAAGAATGFLRPSTGSGDRNADDSFEAAGPIAVVLRKGSPLRVKVTASPRRTKPNQPVEFTATVEGAGAGEKLEFSWYFDDGGAAAGERVRHSFAKRGSYDVVVGVTTPGDRVGASAVVTVQVGAAAEGPDRKGGGTNEEADAPDHGAAEGSGSGLPGAGSGPAAGTPAPAGGDSGAAPQPQPQPQPRRKAERPRPAPAGDVVSGRLLSSGEELPQRQADAPAARTGTPSAEDGGGGLGVSGAAVGLFVTFGLLGLGALAEARGPLLGRFWRA